MFVYCMGHLLNARQLGKSYIASDLFYFSLMLLLAFISSPAYYLGGHDIQYVRRLGISHTSHEWPLACSSADKNNPSTPFS